MSAKPLVLPEVSWKYRRLYSFFVQSVTAGLLVLAILRIHDARSLLIICLALIIERYGVDLVYIAGATVTDLRRMAVAVRAGGHPPEPHP